MFAIRAWQGLIDLLLPPRCLVCSRPPRLSRAPFCEACAEELFSDPRASCPRCAASVGPFAVRDGLCSNCRPAPPPFDAALRLTLYQGAMRDAILRMKHASHEGLAELLGERWAARQPERFRALPIDEVVPVPLHWFRRLRRGYNQAAAIARGLAGELDLPLRLDRLARVRLGPAQKEALTAAQRHDNVRGAFRGRGRLTGRRFLLIDDVMTTGATLTAAAEALKHAGAARVTVAVLARAGW